MRIWLAAALMCTISLAGCGDEAAENVDVAKPAPTDPAGEKSSEPAGDVDSLPEPDSAPADLPGAGDSNPDADQSGSDQSDSNQADAGKADSSTPGEPIPVAQSEPKSAADWAKDLSGSDTKAKQQAADALAGMGWRASEAVPALISALADDDVEVQWRAARALGAIGPAAKDAVPQLSNALQSANPLVRAHAAYTLGRIGGPAKSEAEALAGLLNDSSVHARRAAVGALLSIGLERDQLVKYMLKALEDKEMDPSVTVPALESLASAGQPGIEALTEALKNDRTCYWACVALGSVGPKAESAAPELAKLVSDNEPEVRMQAAMALGEIGPGAKSAVPDLVKALDDEQMSVRYAAAYALGRIGDKQAVDALTKQLETEDKFLQMVSVWALAKLQPDEREAVDRAVEVLVDALKSENPRTRAAAARGLLELDLPRDTVAPTLIELLADKDPVVRANVVDALASLGEQALPRLVKALSNDALQTVAVAVIQRMGPKAKEAVPALAEELKDDDPAHRQEAAFALAAIGPDAKEAVPALIEAVGDETPHVQYTAAYALGRIGPDAAEAQEVLRKNLASDDRFLKIASVWALLRIQPDDNDLRVLAVPLLITAVEEAELDRVKVEAANALGEIGPMAQAAVPALEAAAQDGSADVREAASAALKKVRP